MSSELSDAPSAVSLFNVLSSELRFGTTSDGTPFVVASDFAKLMGYRDAEHATRLLDRAELGAQLVGTSQVRRHMTVIYEDGIWELIFRSTKPEALQLKKRVKQVLAELRRTGRYESDEQFQLPRTYLDALRALVGAEERLEVARPKVDFYDRFIDSDGFYPMSEVAKMLGFGRNRLYRRLRELKIIQPDSTEPYQRYMQHFVLVPETKNHRVFKVTKLTPSGLTWLSRRLDVCVPPSSGLRLVTA
ncbi:phage antirepressor KilAC domain-containing protein [Pseudonocardia sp. ICBG601]|uniref:phage antirepressor KilAC domain-containing protein n=1 Tax=Pseudonocardia sp. ICBG601 TaxID=2846759 RepID=UPI001CF6D817|nr:phage antirepressor KilAC domain-containing protein [Pseudonocardia sp. ICBG601]